MLLVGYEYGTNYLGAPLLGLVVWCVVCFALNTLLDWLYEKTGCIWVPAIAHGAFNAIAALPQVLVTPADAYYNVLGPMPIGLIAALPMLAAAVWLTLREMKQEEKNRIPRQQPLHFLCGGCFCAEMVVESSKQPLKLSEKLDDVYKAQKKAKKM